MEYKDCYYSSEGDRKPSLDARIGRIKQKKAKPKPKSLVLSIKPASTKNASSKLQKSHLSWYSPDFRYKPSGYILTSLQILTEGTIRFMSPSVRPSRTHCLPREWLPREIEERSNSQKPPIMKILALEHYGATHLDFIDKF